MTYTCTPEKPSLSRKIRLVGPQINLKNRQKTYQGERIFALSSRFLWAPEVPLVSLVKERLQNISKPRNSRKQFK